MAITYTWQDESNTSLKYVDDSTTPDTELFIPVAAGNRHYVDYQTWVAAGNVATAYAHPGHDTIVSSRATRVTEAKEAVESWILQYYKFEIRRASLNTGYSLPSNVQTAIDTAYALLDTFTTAVNSENDIEDVRLSTIDFTGNAYNIPA